MLLLGFIFACSTNSSDQESKNDVKNLEPIPDVLIADLPDFIATEVCSRLFSCCDEESKEIYFYNYQANDLLADYHRQLPPEDEASCATILADMLDEVWLGAWSQQVEKGLVEYVPSQAGECTQSLRQADCGEELRTALFDGECFGFSAPTGGESQRRMFQRNNAEGDSCETLLDGYGGLYFGSCNPAEAFCCTLPNEEGCNPYPLAEQEGTCQAVSKVGESCSTLPPIQLCQSGLECDYTSNQCIEINISSIFLGDTCYDPQNFELLGFCEDSWCNVSGSNKCEPLIPNDQACSYSESCESNYCDAISQVCIDNPICDQ